MKRKKLIFIGSVLFLLLFCSLFQLVQYVYTQNTNEKMVSYCTQQNSSECNVRMFERLIPELLIFIPLKDRKNLIYAKIDTNDSLWQPFFVLESADIFIDYMEFLPLSIDNEFDYYSFYAKENFSLETFRYIVQDGNSIDFVRENFKKRLDDIRKEKKKLVLNFRVDKIDKEFFKTILEFSDVILQLNLFLKFDDSQTMVNAKETMELINKYFILVSRNLEIEDKAYIKLSSKYYNGIFENSVFALSYINKNIVDDFKISLIQNPAKVFVGEKVLWYENSINPPLTDVSFVVTFVEKIKELLAFNKKGVK